MVSLLTVKADDEPGPVFSAFPGCTGLEVSSSTSAGLAASRLFPARLIVTNAWGGVLVKKRHGGVCSVCLDTETRSVEAKEEQHTRTTTCVVVC